MLHSSLHEYEILKFWLLCVTADIKNKNTKDNYRTKKCYYE